MGSFENLKNQVWKSRWREREKIKGHQYQTRC
jgi:hypothetical protein